MHTGHSIPCRTWHAQVRCEGWGGGGVGGQPNRRRWVLTPSLSRAVEQLASPDRQPAASSRLPGAQRGSACGRACTATSTRGGGRWRRQRQQCGPCSELNFGRRRTCFLMLERSVHTIQRAADLAWCCKLPGPKCCEERGQTGMLPAQAPAVEQAGALRPSDPF